jgi:hypothetical protein
MSFTENLHQVVIEHSISKDWNTAQLEWLPFLIPSVIDVTARCVCHHEIKYCHRIYNIHTGDQLYPIGSECIKNFHHNVKMQEYMKEIAQLTHRDNIRNALLCLSVSPDWDVAPTEWHVVRTDPGETECDCYKEHKVKKTVMLRNTANNSTLTLAKSCFDILGVPHLNDELHYEFTYRKSGYEVWLEDYPELLDPNKKPLVIEIKAAVKDCHSKYYLKVPYAQKDNAKLLGAQWDADVKKWWCGKGRRKLFSKWL